MGSKEFLSNMNKERFFYVCFDCHKTVKEINKDHECKQCVKMTEKLRERFLK